MLTVPNYSPVSMCKSLNNSQKQITFGQKEVPHVTTKSKIKISNIQILKMALGMFILSNIMRLLRKRVEKASVKQYKDPAEKEKHLEINRAAQSINTLIYEDNAKFFPIDDVSQNVTNALDKYSPNSSQSQFVKDVMQFVKENQKTPLWYSIHEFGSGWRVDKDVQRVLITAQTALQLACNPESHTEAEKSEFDKRMEEAREIMKNYKPDFTKEEKAEQLKNLPTYSEIMDIIKTNDHIELTPRTNKRND